jgi:hypothetical protein
MRKQTRKDSENEPVKKGWKRRNEKQENRKRGKKIRNNWKKEGTNQKIKETVEEKSETMRNKKFKPTVITRLSKHHFCKLSHQTYDRHDTRAVGTAVPCFIFYEGPSDILSDKLDFIKSKNPFGYIISLLRYSWTGFNDEQSLVWSWRASHVFWINFKLGRQNLKHFFCFRTDCFLKVIADFSCLRVPAIWWHQNKDYF